MCTAFTLVDKKVQRSTGSEMAWCVGDDPARLSTPLAISVANLRRASEGSRSEIDLISYSIPLTDSMGGIASSEYLSVIYLLGMYSIFQPVSR